MLQPKKGLIYRAVLALFICAEAAIYIAFNTITLSAGEDPVMLKYSGILLCVGVSLIFAFLTQNRADAFLVFAALCFTAVSDFFIYVKNDYYEVGVFTFIIVQCLYLTRITLWRGFNKKRFIISLSARVLVMAILFIVFGCLGWLELLVAECIVYIIMLVGNAAEAFTFCKTGVVAVIFAVGLLLFIGCDVCVGLNNFGSTLGIALSKGVMSFVAVAMWAFYLPSQALITCSVSAASPRRR